MGDKKKEYRDKRTGMQTVRSAIFAIVLIITGFISIIYVADNTYAADKNLAVYFQFTHQNCDRFLSGLYTIYPAIYDLCAF